MSQFAFLDQAWPGVLDAASRAEASVRSDPRSAGFYARRALELAMHWLCKRRTRKPMPKCAHRPPTCCGAKSRP